MLSCFTFIAFTDACIYWIHRFLHHRLVYKHLHKTHHTWKVPTPFASHAFHPMDGFLQSCPYHLYLFLFPLHKVRCPSFCVCLPHHKVRCPTFCLHVCLPLLKMRCLSLMAQGEVSVFLSVCLPSVSIFLFVRLPLHKVRCLSFCLSVSHCTW